MKDEIKILLLEDNLDDVELYLSQLNKADFNFSYQHTYTEDGYKNALVNFNPDIVLSDYNMPQYTGMEALLATREYAPTLPFIIVTGSMNEETAIECIKSGADDYLIKEHLGRLGFAVKAAITKRENEKEKLKLQKAIVESEKKYRKIFENIRDIFYQTDSEGYLVEISPSIEYRSGYKREEVLNQHASVFYKNKEDRDRLFEILSLKGEVNDFETQLNTKSGETIYVSISAHFRLNDKNEVTGIDGAIRDITERKRAEIELKESEERFRAITDTATDAIISINSAGKIISWNNSANHMFGYTFEEAMLNDLSIIVPEKFNDVHNNAIERLFKDGNEMITGQVLELSAKRRDGSEFPIELSLSSWSVQNEKFYSGIIRDISERHKAQEALKESEAKYRLLAENSNDVIFVLDFDFNYVYLSPSVEKLRGLKAEEAIKGRITDFLTPESAQSLNREISRVLPLLKSDEIYNIDPLLIELEMIKVDGSTLWAEVKVSVIFDDNKVPIGFQGVTRDITARKKAIDELRKLSRAIEQSNASVIITDINGNIEFVNPKFEEVTGYNINEIIGKNPKILKSGMMSDELYRNLWDKITTGNTWNGEFLNKRKDGTVYWESASISPIKNASGNTTHYLAIKEDITEKKKFEEELILARNQAEESNRLKSAFLATMSHELRTPLNAIIGFSDVAEESMDKQSLLSFLKTINNSGKHLLNIIEDIFSLSLLQSGQSKVVAEEFRLSDFLTSIIQYINVELTNRKKKHLTIKYPENILRSNVRIKTDKTKLSQVLINFIKNAIEYTDYGEIEINVLQANNEFIFYVRDTGIGIPEEKTDLIFERFRQLDDSFTRSHGGVGLGLSICSEIARLLGGKLSVSSELNKGSTFYFALEDVEVKSDKTVDNVIHNVHFPDLTSKTILVVEDIETNYLLLYNILKKINAEVIWAQTGEQAIDICRNKNNIDLIFMDIRMPGLNGYQTAEEIKKFCDLPIIAQTAYAFPSDKEMANQSVCDDYLAKPLRMPDISRVLQKFL